MSEFFIKMFIRIVNESGSDKVREKLRQKLLKGAKKTDLSKADRDQLELIASLID